MAEEGRPSGVEDERSQTQVLRWQDDLFFCSSRSVTSQCAKEIGTINAQVGVKANVQMRLDYLLVALQQVLSFFRINSAVLNEMMENI